jgi:hypothetical protein
MNWRIDDHPEGGLQITHLAAPRFTARWTTGEFPIDAIKDGEFFWTDEGSGEDDAIHLWGFVWDDPLSRSTRAERLMTGAVIAIERFISDGR